MLQKFGMQMEAEASTSAMAASGHTLSEGDWLRAMRACTVSKATMNKLVMDYLVIEGHKEAAQCFQDESGTAPGIDLETISDRRAIRAAVEAGDVVSAMEGAKRTCDPGLFNEPELLFHVQQQQLIELVRAGRIEEAVAYAQAELASQAEASPAFLAELERTMLLLAYEDASACPEAELLSQAQRQRTASRLNAAILSAQAQQTEAALPMILRRLAWAQDELQLRQMVAAPRVTDFQRAALTAPQASEEDADAAVSAMELGA